MSEQPTRPKLSASSAATERADALVFDGNIDASLLRQVENVTEDPLLADRGHRIARAHFQLAHQEQVDVVRRQPVVERRLYEVTGARRTHDARRDDDGEIGLVREIRRAAEQRPEDR